MLQDSLSQQFQFMCHCQGLGRSRRPGWYVVGITMAVTPLVLMPFPVQAFWSDAEAQSSVQRDCTILLPHSICLHWMQPYQWMSMAHLNVMTGKALYFTKKSTQKLSAIDHTSSQSTFTLFPHRCAAALHNSGPAILTTTRNTKFGVKSQVSPHRDWTFLHWALWEPRDDTRQGKR